MTRTQDIPALTDGAIADLATERLLEGLASGTISRRGTAAFALDPAAIDKAGVSEAPCPTGVHRVAVLKDGLEIAGLCSCLDRFDGFAKFPRSAVVTAVLADGDARRWLAEAV